MNIEQTILETVRKLPQEKQEEVLHFTQLLQQKIFLPSPPSNLTPQEKATHWLKWVKSHSPSNHPPLPEKVLHRDAMYN